MSNKVSKISNSQADYLRRKVKEQEEKIRKLNEAVYECGRAMDAVLVQVCAKYGEEGVIDIPVPVVDKAQISVKVVDGRYIISAVTNTESIEE